jgi:PLP dependent protein
MSEPPLSEPPLSEPPLSDPPAGADFDAGVAAAVASVRDRIEAVAGGRTVHLVAVTKGFGAEAPAAAVRAGVLTCGENYAQELVAKANAIDGLVAAGALAVAPAWHMLGRVQRNKVRQLAPHVAVWQSVDRLELGEEIARRQPAAVVHAQVNISGEDTKSGCAPADAAVLVDGLRQLGLDVRGLMGIGPAGPAEASRPAFALLVRLAEELGLPERSIGMTGDFEVAVEEGATSVRVGTALFGARPPRGT